MACLASYQFRFFCYIMLDMILVGRERKIHNYLSISHKAWTRISNIASHVCMQTENPKESSKCLDIPVVVSMVTRHDQPWWIMPSHPRRTAMNIRPKYRHLNSGTW